MSAQSKPSPGEVRAADYAFVIQFDPIAHGRRRFRGRVEQVASGEVAHFRTLKELIGFLMRQARVLGLGLAGGLIIGSWAPARASIPCEKPSKCLTTGNFQNVGSCSTGVRQMSSEVPFGLWVWGWGSAASTPQTRNVSYGYPGGMSVQSINTVVF